MAHPIPAYQNPLFKKGDRIQHLDTGQFATVVEDQNHDLFIKIEWDKNPSGLPETFMAEAFRIAPWHEINIKDFDRREVLGEFRDE